jgi:hypothetical protein
MKKILTLAVIGGVLLSAVPSASAVTVYTENWGTGNSGVTGNGNISTVGWTAIAASQSAGPYVGIYTATGANDPTLGLALPANTVYFTGFQSTNLPGMFYTTDTSGQGIGGNSSFSDINPTLYTNLTFNLEIRGAATDTNYFAVQVGGQWYVATSYQLPGSSGIGYPQFTNDFLVYTNPANVWQSLTINGTTNVTVGSVASPSLTATITGIGIVELPTGGGFNYNELIVNQGPGDFPQIAPTNTALAVSPQYVYVGGGAAFVSTFAGPLLVYQWQTNGVNISGGRYLGTAGPTMTITNCNLGDAGSFYMVVVTNKFGSATNSGLQLIVSNVPPGLLYAENFPYLGPNGNYPITGVGWVVAAPANTSVGIYQVGGGLGDAFSYSPTATTNAYYTTDTNDIGISGLPFVDINPASYPYVTFQAGFVPGNAAGQVSGAVSVYWAVKMTNGWYCSAQPQAIDLSALSPYQTYQYGFNSAASNWNNLTITSSNAVIGAAASGPLTGNIIGAGLVVAHNTGSGSDMNFQNFEIITNQAVGTLPNIGLTGHPLDVSVASGGGASFGVSATGSAPFTYGWTTNGVTVSDGGRVSGAATPTLTIANLNSNDNGLQIVAYVTNSAGVDNSSTGNGVTDPGYGGTTLTVTNPPVGFVYSEVFPFVGPAVANYPISGVGWVEAVPSTPNALFQAAAQTSAGAVFAYLGNAGTTVYYATTATDTNQSGLPFPNVDLAAYPGLNFSVDIAPNSATASNVTAYLAVQLNGTNWYVAANALLGPNAASNSVYSTYTSPFNPAAANWKNLTVTSSGGIIGSAATSNLSGVMTGAGLVFVTTGTGGTFNFGNFVITGTGVGGIINGPLAGGNINLSWVGNPAVKLQSSTNLGSNLNWQDVPNTYGLYSLPVSVTGPQKFFRLTSP